MLSAFSNNKWLPKWLGLLFVVISLFLMMPAYADEAPPVIPGDTGIVAPDPNAPQVAPTAAPTPTNNSLVSNAVPTAGDMIENIAKQLPDVMRLVTAVAFVMGIVFIFMGVSRMKHLGEMRTMMSHEHSVKGPIIYIAVGAALLYLPSTIQIGMSTFWSDPNPYGYVVEKDQWSQFINTCLMVVQLFGVIAFIRGLVILAHLGGGQGGGQHGGLGKGMTHIIGGIFCINIYQFVHVVMVTLGIQFN